LDIVTRLAGDEWEIEAINNKVPDSVALEYRLRSKLPQRDGGRAYRIVRGLGTGTSDEFLETHFARELADRPILRTA
jgi:hypothetical protein